MAAVGEAAAFEVLDSSLEIAIGMGLRSRQAEARRPDKIAVLESAGDRCSSPGPAAGDLGTGRTVEVPGAEWADCWGMVAVAAAAAACTGTMGPAARLISSAAGPLGDIHILDRHRLSLGLDWGVVAEGGIGLHSRPLAVVAEAAISAFPIRPTWLTTLYWCAHLG